MKTVWLDTDIGSDIDDALALAYLLSRDDCNLIGISTVTEVGTQRAQLASALCRIAGKDVPIYPGLPLPLLVEPRQTTVPQVIALPRWPHSTNFAGNCAIDALRAAVRARPGEVSLLAIGPMTNIGVLFALDPEIPALLKELVLMCGTFVWPDWPEAVEWNAVNDPHATALVYRANPPRHVSFGFDVTRLVVLNRAEFEARISVTELGRCALDMAAAWFETTAKVTFHDPLAAAGIFEPSLCGTASGHVEVELENAALLGKTYWTPAEHGPQEVAATVDAPRFFEHFFGVLETRN
jgi:purine nucleosidase